MKGQKIIIAISGKMGSGKSTLANALLDSFVESGYGNANIVKFADPIYDASLGVYNALNLPFEKDRELLQFLGTHFKQKFDTNFWVREFKARVKKSPGPIIVDDLRFMEEFDALVDMRATIVRLNCDYYIREQRCGKGFKNTNHPSETGLDSLQPGEYDLCFDSDFESPGRMVEIIRAHINI